MYSQLILTIFIFLGFVQVVRCQNKDNSTDKFDKFVVFGDSWSDNGNTFRLTGGNFPSPTEFYYSGRYSDGPLWSEFLSNVLGTTFFDFAYAGASTDNNQIQGYVPGGGLENNVPLISVPGLIQQIEKFNEFQASKNGTLDLSRTLVSTWLKGKQYFTFSYTNSSTGITVATPPELVIQSFLEAWKKLYSFGIRFFLVLTLPSITSFPFYSKLPSSLSSLLQNITQQHNALLSSAIVNFQTTYQGVKFFFFDFEKFKMQYVENRRGFNNLFDEIGVCVREVTKYDTEEVEGEIREKQGVEKCGDEGQVFWYDLWNFGRDIHKALAERIGGTFKGGWREQL
ncbi:hypothetical protein G9A89_022378 [Geosiphon pyriformis]|nr:hypothetical protein G9A89_022378 [Geosiphon pyriformis]